MNGEGCAKYAIQPAGRSFSCASLTWLFNILLAVVLVIIVAEMIGVETTSFIAVLGVAGLAIGLALKESLFILQAVYSF